MEIAEHGAELMSVYDIVHETELLWNADPAYWKRRSPILFPYVGKCWQGKVKINGKTFTPSAHGFARDRNFICEQHDDISATFLLRSDEDTKKMYPFDFALRVTYVLNGRELKVSWHVDNLSDSEMPFTIGGHPAFAFADFSQPKTDYSLEFPGMDALRCVLLDLPTGTITPDRQEIIALEDGILPLNERLFDGDTLVMDDGQISEVWLCHRNGARRVGVKCAGFPNFGIWSMPNAPFVCLEPWMGRCDNYGFDGELRDKPNVNRVAPGQAFDASYSILLP